MSECIFEFIKLDPYQDGEQIIVPKKRKKNWPILNQGFYNQMF